MKRYYLTIALAGAATMISGCGESEDSGPTTPTPAVTLSVVPRITTPATATVARTPQALSVECEAVPDQYLTAISQAFSNPSESLLDTYAVQAETGVLYIGGNIMEGDRKVSSADVWVADGPTVYSLSGDARRRTTLDDGRDILNASAGDEWGEKVQNCVTTAERNRNMSGGN